LHYSTAVPSAGNCAVLTGLLQEKLGYIRQLVLEEIDKRVAEYEASLKKSTVPHPINDRDVTTLSQGI
jgi:hypothetical protein